MSKPTKKVPKHEKVDYKKVKHGLSLLETGKWPPAWSDGLESLKSYFRFVVNAADTMPSLIGSKEKRDSKTWTGIIKLAATPGAMKRHERLCKIRQHLTQATNQEQRAYGNAYSHDGLNALLILNALVNTSQEELMLPCVGLRFHTWEYWNGSYKDRKDMLTLYFTKTAEDMLVFVNKDVPYLPQQICSGSLSVIEAKALTTIQKTSTAT